MDVTADVIVSLGVFGGCEGRASRDEVVDGFRFGFTGSAGIVV